MNTAIDNILDRYQRDPGQLVAMLHDIQAAENWLPKEILSELSNRLDIPLSRVFSVASFFKAFSLVPKGRHVATICMGTACHVRGAPRILDIARQSLGIEPGETTPDLKFSLETVGCLGCCALGPIMVLDGEYHGHFSASDAQKVLEKCE
jgi:NADH-quinone oxidoreductase subunit E